MIFFQIVGLKLSNIISNQLLISIILYNTDVVRMLLSWGDFLDAFWTPVPSTSDSETKEIILPSLHPNYCMGHLESGIAATCPSATGSVSRTATRLSLSGRKDIDFLEQHTTRKWNRNCLMVQGRHKMVRYGYLSRSTSLPCICGRWKNHARRSKWKVINPRSAEVVWEKGSWIDLVGRPWEYSFFKTGQHFASRDNMFMVMFWSRSKWRSPSNMSESTAKIARHQNFGSDAMGLGVSSLEK